MDGWMDGWRWRWRSRCMPQRRPRGQPRGRGTGVLKRATCDARGPTRLRIAGPRSNCARISHGGGSAI
eukprot:scaffold3886_cov399-Prasinococcus_capsulatus_cf.AAC.7